MTKEQFSFISTIVSGYCVDTNSHFVLLVQDEKRGGFMATSMKDEDANRVMRSVIEMNEKGGRVPFDELEKDDG